MIQSSPWLQVQAALHSSQDARGCYGSGAAVTKLAGGQCVACGATTVVAISDLVYCERRLQVSEAAQRRAAAGGGKAQQRLPVGRRQILHHAPEQLHRGAAGAVSAAVPACVWGVTWLGGDGWGGRGMGKMRWETRGQASTGAQAAAARMRLLPVSRRVVSLPGR